MASPYKTSTGQPSLQEPSLFDTDAEETLPAKADRVRSPISDWPASERPAARLLQRGSCQASDAELLSLLLGQDVITQDGEFLTSLDMARALLKAHGSLYKLSRRSALEATRTPLAQQGVL